MCGCILGRGVVGRSWGMEVTRMGGGADGRCIVISWPWVLGWSSICFFYGGRQRKISLEVIGDIAIL